MCKWELFEEKRNERQAVANEQDDERSENVVEFQFLSKYIRRLPGFNFKATTSTTRYGSHSFRKFNPEAERVKL